MTVSVEEELLIGGLDDLIQAAEVVWVVGGLEHGDDAGHPALVDTAALRAQVADAVSHLVTDGLVQVGGVGRASDGRFDVVPWSIDPHEVHDRVLDAMVALGRLPGLWELFWLKNTPAGDAVARRALERER